MNSSLIHMDKLIAKPNPQVAEQQCSPPSLSSGAEQQCSPPTTSSAAELHSSLQPEHSSGEWKKPRRGRICGAEAKRRRRARENEARAAAAAHSSRRPPPPSAQPAHKKGAEQPKGVPPSRGDRHPPRKAEHPQGMPPQRKVEHPQGEAPKKRNRSGTSSETSPRDPKRAKQGPGPKASAPPTSYKEAALGHLKVAIIDKDNPSGKIPKDKEVLIKKLLMGELDKILFTAPTPSSTTKPPTFRSWTYSGEIIRVFCEDEETRSWLTTTVGSLRPWENATLAVVSIDKLPRLTKSTLWIPVEAESDFEEKEVVVRRLAAQNPALGIGRWCIFHHEAKDDPKGHLLVFGIGDEAMETLRTRSMRVNYIFQSLTLKVKPDKLAEQASAEASLNQPHLMETEQDQEAMEMETKDGEVGSLVRVDATSPTPNAGQPEAALQGLSLDPGNTSSLHSLAEEEMN